MILKSNGLEQQELLTSQPLWVRNPKVVSLWFWLRVYWEAAVQMLVWASLGLRICEMAPCDDCWQEGTPMGLGYGEKAFQANVTLCRACQGPIWGSAWG